MLCTNCNAQVNDGSSFCSGCGRPVVSGSTGQLGAASPGARFIELPPCLRGAIVLRPKEGIVGIWSAYRLKMVHGPEGEKEVSEPGYLVVSNHRTFFIKESGLFSKSYSAIETIAYENLTGVTVKRGLLSVSLLISHDHGETRIVRMYNVDANGKANGKAEAPETAHRILQDTAQARLHELEREKQMGRVQYVLDFSFLKAEMEKGGIVVQTIKCPACSAGMTLPSSGSNVKCPYCGSMVYAQDIFEKVKGLIGTA